MDLDFDKEGPSATVILTNGVGTVAHDKVKTASQRSRSNILKPVSEKARANCEEALRLLDGEIRRRAGQKAPAEKTKSPLSAEQLAKANALLQDPQLVGKFLETAERLGSVGQEEQKVVLLLACASALTDSPVNVTVKASSSAGKNALVEAVTQFFPSDRVELISGMSPKALFYRDESLKNMVLVIAEATGSEAAEYSLRTLESEGKLTYCTVDKDANGSQKYVKKEVEGPVAIIETTTRAHLHAENETRHFDVFLDESHEQTGRIHNAQARQAMDPSLKTMRAAVIEPWRHALGQLASVPVVVPFADKIQFPTHKIRTRRDYPRLLALIKASALLHQAQRRRVTVNGVKCVEAAKADYVIVFETAGRMLDHALKGATPRCQELVKTVEAKFGPFGDTQPDGEFTRGDVQQALDWDYNTVSKHLSEAAHLGLIETTTGGGKGRGNAFRYRFIQPISQKAVSLTHPDQIE